MVTRAGDISINLTLTDADFTVSVKNAGVSLRQLQRDLNRTAEAADATQSHFTSFATRLRHTMTTVAAARFAVLDFHDVFLRLPMAMIRSSGEIERMTKLMSGLSKESSDLKRNQEGLSNTKFVFGLAQKAPFEVKALSDSFVKLKSVGLDPTNGSLQTLVDSVARFGGTSETLHRASVAIQQMMGKGVISMEELRQQLGEAIPDAMQAMALGTGMSMSELVDKISKGTVEASSALERMFAVLKVQNDGAALKMMDSWVGQVEKLKTNWMLFSNEVGNSGGFFQEMKKQLESLNELFADPKSLQYAHSLSIVLKDMVIGIVDGISLIRKYWEEIKFVGEAMAAVWAGGRLFAAVNLVKDAYKAFAASVVASMGAVITAEKTRIASANAAAAAEHATNQRRILEEARANAQMIVSRSAADKALLASNRARYVQEMAEATAHRAAYHRAMAQADAASRVGATQTVIDQRQIATAYFERAMAAERMAAQIKAAEAGLVASSTGTMAALRANTLAAQAQMTALGAATVVTASRMSMLAGAIRLLGGPIGIITTLLTAGVFAWYQWGRSAEEAANRARDAIQRAKDGYATLADAQELSARIAVLDAQLAEKEEQKKKKDTMRDVASANKIGAEITKLKRDREDAKKALQQSLEQGAEASIKDSVRLVANVVDATINAEKSAINKKMQAKFELLDKDLAAEKITKEQHFKKRAELIAEQGQKMAQAEIKAYKAQIVMVNREIARIEGGVSASKVGGTAYNGYLRQLNDLTDKLRQAESSLASAGKIGTSPDFMGGKGGDKDTRSPYAKMYDDLEEKLKALKAEILDPGTKEATERLEELANGKFGKEGQRAENIAAVEIRYREIESLKAFVKARKDVEGQIGTFQGKIASLRGELADAVPESEKLADWITTLQMDLSKFAGAADNDVQEAVTKLIQQLTDLRMEFESLSQQVGAKKVLEKAEAQFAGLSEKAHGGSSAVAKMRLEIEKLIATTTDADALTALQKALGFVVKSEGVENDKNHAEALKAIEGFRYASKKIYADLAEDRISPARLSYDADVKMMRAGLDERLATGKLAIGEEKRLNDEFNSWVEARAAKMAREMETPLQAMARNWADVTKNMEQATVNWSTSFVDMMVEATETGEYKWRDFLTNMLKDVYRISLQKTLSGAIDGAIGGIGQIFEGMINGNKATVGAGGAAVTDVFEKSVRFVSDKLREFGMDSVADSISKMFQGNAVKVTETTITQTATTQMAQLTIAVASATQALHAFAASAGGGGGTGGLLGGIVDMLGGGAAWDTGIDFAQSADVFDMMDFADISAWSPFANGGIMTEFGSVPLRKYANGGVARSPQLAMYGEGSMPEAYVPLPDGRSIPVSMSGGGGDNVSISIVVNNDGSESSNGDEGGTWRRMADRVKSVVRDEMATQKRPGGMLYK